MMNCTSTVCFVTLVLSHYRVPFHNRVREILTSHGIDYRLIYSDPTGDAAAKSDTSSLDWAIRVPVTSMNFFGQTFHWLPVWRYVKGSDLTIVSQENKLLHNYWLQARYILFGKRLGFFGHGRSSAVGRFPRLSRALKRFLATKVHWWFAYTPEVADLLDSYGFPRDRISVNYNSIDTVALLRELDTVTDKEIAEFLEALKMRRGCIGLYLGGIYGDKRIDFLIEAARRVRDLVPDFELLIVGSGSHAPLAEHAAREQDYIHFAGPRFGREKAMVLKASRACLIPGAVGLAILDSFAASCPLVTTAAPGHGPEIDYLVDGENGVLVRDPNNIEDYCQAVVRIMTDDRYLHILKKGCQASAQNYSIENMAQHFCEGVRKAVSNRP